MHRPHFRRVLALAVAALLLAVSCTTDDGTDEFDASPTGADATGPGASGADPVLRIVNSYTVNSLDPALAGNQWLFDFGASEAPLARNEAGELEPWLIEEIESIDPTTWHLTLYPDVTFQHGGAVDAEALAASINRQIEQAANAVQLEGSVATALDDLVVELTTPEPNANVPAALAERGAFPVYDVSIVDEVDGDSDALIGTGFYTGPYAITDWTPEYLELARNDNYWNGEPPLAGIEVEVVSDESARILAVRSGEADMAMYPPLEAGAVLAGDDSATLLASELALQSIQMPLNLQSPPFDERDTRKAFALSLDYEELGTDVTAGMFEPARGLYPPGLPYTVDTFDQDLDEAAALLDAAGWTLGSDGVRTRDGERLEVIVLPTAQGPETQPLAIAIQAQAARVGFDVRIVNVEDQAEAMDDPDGWNAALQLSGTVSGTGDPIDPFARNFASDGDRNSGGISNPELDEIAHLLPTEFDEEAREDLLRRAQEIVGDEEVYVLVAAYKRFMFVVSPEYADYEVSSFRRHITMDTRPS